MSEIIDSLVIPKEKIKELNLKRFVMLFRELTNEPEEEKSSKIWFDESLAYLCPFDDCELNLKILKNDLHYDCPICKRVFNLIEFTENSVLIEVISESPN